VQSKQLHQQHCSERCCLISTTPTTFTHRQSVTSSGVATGWTGVDMSTPLLLQVAPEIDTNPTSFYRGRGRRKSVRLRFGLDSPVGSIRSFESGRLAVLEFAYKSRWLCPWTPLGAPPPDPRYRLALCAGSPCLSTPHILTWRRPCLSYRPTVAPTWTKLGDCVFSITGLTACHSLPYDIRNITDTTTFKRRLKFYFLTTIFTYMPRLLFYVVRYVLC